MTGVENFLINTKIVSFWDVIFWSYPDNNTGSGFLKIHIITKCLFQDLENFDR